MASIQAKKVPNNQIKKFLIFLLFGSLMFLCGFYTHSEYKNVLEIMDDIKVKHKLTKVTLTEKVKDQMVNFPWDFFAKSQYGFVEFNETCAKFPSLDDLHFNNIFWQQAAFGSKGILSLYAAYYDDRFEHPVVSILMTSDKVDVPGMFCQFWFENEKQPIISAVEKKRFLWIPAFGNVFDGVQLPYLFTCPLPNESIPIAVSLVERECETPNNILKVIWNEVVEGPKKKTFLVCSKGMYFNEAFDTSVKLIEWIEILKAYGVTKIVLYVFSSHSNVIKVLDYYRKQEFVEYHQISLPGFQPSLSHLQHIFIKTRVTARWQNEMIHFHDCVYRNMNKYNYVTLLDPDEVIVPRQTNSWTKLAEELENQVFPTDYDSFVFSNIFFTEDMLENHADEQQVQKLLKGIPSHMYMMKHIIRGTQYSKDGGNIKCFHKLNRLVQVHHHFPIACLHGGCNFKMVDTQLGHLQHYRIDCNEPLGVPECINYTTNTDMDLALWNIKDVVIPEVNKVMEKLKIS